MPVLIPPLAISDGFRPGSLNGRTLFRFLHAREAGGGMERLIEDLDQTLLERNKLTVVRMYFGRGARVQRAEESRGQGRLLRIGMPSTPGLESSYAEEPIGSWDWRKALRRHVLNHPMAWRCLIGPWVRQRRLRPRPGEMIGAGSAFRDLAREFRFDLCLMHFFGGADADEVMREARRLGIPIALSNHYANDRFLHLAIRQHVLLADRVAGVNGLQVPDFLQPDFVNLADGIDLDFFDPQLARPLEAPSALPVLFLPARVLRSKGHWDVVQCARRLHDQGLPVHVAFAGRADSGRFVTELRREVERLRLSAHVQFLGPLNPWQLRDWYHASAATVFPTYHAEGLGRITIESQAIGTPPVAYATGGVAEGIRDGETGFLVRTGDVATLSARVGAVLRDPALRRRLSENGRSFVAQIYGLPAFAARHEAFYRSAFRQ
jgi:glycosyltransferase involved in cell wall biosynthesis